MQSLLLIAAIVGANHVYSIHELVSGPAIADDTVITVHAQVWQGEHGIILTDENCKGACDDVMGLDVVSDTATAAFDKLKLMGPFGKGPHTYIVMKAKPFYRLHPVPPGNPGRKPRMGIARLELVSITSATNETYHRWLVSH
ncbi:MAG: hypothetical protein ACXU8O_09490 [Asticcacaulis sp.]